MIHALVGERQSRRDEAVADISAKWGAAQTLAGPMLVLPYTAVSAPGRVEVRQAVMLPDRVHIHGSIQTDSRRRGIFDVPVYRLRVAVDGAFGKLSLADLAIDSTAILWDRAHLVIAISDVRAIQEQVSMLWNGQPIAFLPGTLDVVEFPSGIHASVPVNAGTTEATFSLTLAVNGSLAASFSPTAENTMVELQSNEPNPSFVGNWLPTERTVSASGFNARWAVPALGRNYPQAWTSTPNMANSIIPSRFGVELGHPIDQYRMAERSVKYAILFVLLTFASVWLVEVLARVRVHPIQYLLLGASLALFYLLELSLSEHLPFAVAYSVASLSVIGMVTGYGVVIFGRVKPALAISLGVTTLWGYLYVLLTNEDYALLIGAVGLFLALGGIMIATRRVNWYSDQFTAKQ